MSKGEPAIKIVVPNKRTEKSVLKTVQNVIKDKRLDLVVRKDTVA